VKAGQPSGHTSVESPPGLVRHQQDKDGSAEHLTHASVFHSWPANVERCRSERRPNSNLVPDGADYVSSPERSGQRLYTAPKSFVPSLACARKSHPARLDPKGQRN
jgi:hypothetical protein